MDNLLAINEVMRSDDDVLRRVYNKSLLIVIRHLLGATGSMLAVRLLVVLDVRYPR